ncbi:nickel-dependent hydrogenase large subunit [Methanolobus profundi]|uniref:Methanophenazine-reducing hydrogenase, large subunit n=1 Tax=Methanolobus profundi TaxID=487685 RepID=A0A1I4QLX4_9EURY|nr:nickel-dependent hydrogenase large subunit [Methanolobus profundi]SFM40653.1 methanophenazine-reducing hydrogenase, large subunit [Methanolobus profundi]
MTNVTIDPLTRIQGHFRLSTEVNENGVITDAQSSGMLFRGLERILVNRDPRDAARITQRVCGVCPTAHAITSANALEDLFGIADQIPKDALVTRNIMQSLNMIDSHATHTYALWLPDLVNPAYRDVFATADNMGTMLWRELLHRFAPLSYKIDGISIPPGQAYVNAIKEKRRLHGSIALIAGKMPHQMSTIFGGVTYKPTVADIGKLTYYHQQLMDFVDKYTLGIDHSTWLDNTYRASSPQRAVEFVTGHLQELTESSMSSNDFSYSAGWGDIDMLLAFGSETIGEDILGLPVSFKFDRTGTYSDPANIGFLSYGAYYDVENGDGYDPLKFGQNSFHKAAFITGSLEHKKFDHMKITEEVSHSFYTGEGDDHPFDGDTEPVRNADEIDYHGGSQSKYTWIKAPRYEGVPCEVGPIARMIAMQEPLTTGLMNTFSDNGHPAVNTYIRMVARVQEMLILLERLIQWVTSDLDPDGRFSVPIDMSMAKDSQGVGLWEGARGALGHWIKTGTDSKVSKYQMVVPTTWNASPRDSNGIPGPIEQALIGTKVSAAENMLGIDNSNPTGILHTSRAYDPCIACAVHTIDLRQKDGKGERVFDIV